GITHLETGNIDKGMASYVSALNTQKSTQDSVGMANTYVGISSLYKRTAKLDLALLYLDSALYIYERKGKLAEISIVRHNKTNIYTTLNDYPKALEQAQLALEYNLANGLNQKVAMTLHNLGTIYLSLDEKERGKEYFERSIKLKQELGMEGGVAVSLSSLATLLAEDKKLNESKLAFLEVRKIYQKLDRQCNLVQVELSLANTYKSLEQLDSAIYYLKRVQQGSVDCQADDLKAKADIALGEIYEETDRLVEAERLYFSGYQLGERTQVNIIKMQAAEKLYGLYKSQNNTSKALQYFEIAQNLEDSLFNEENNRKIARLESQFRFDQEKAILEEQYKQQQILQQAELTKERLIRNAVIVIAAVFILLSLLILFYYRKVKEQNQLLSQQNSRIYK
ncbi:MAG: tetratricopeptide repeat protein, partial [Bacteroidota bacterium]